MYNLSRDILVKLKYRKAQIPSHWFWNTSSSCGLSKDVQSTRYPEEHCFSLTKGEHSSRDARRPRPPVHQGPALPDGQEPGVRHPRHPAGGSAPLSFPEWRTLLDTGLDITKHLSPISRALLPLTVKYFSETSIIRISPPSPRTLSQGTSDRRYCDDQGSLSSQRFRPTMSLVGVLQEPASSCSSIEHRP